MSRLSTPSPLPAWQHLHGKNDTWQLLEAIKQNRRKRSQYREVLVEGIEAVKQALASSQVTLRKFICADPAALSDWGSALWRQGRFQELVRMDKALYDELSDKDDPAELMVTLEYAHRSLDAIALPPDPLILIFDRPSDRGNLGSVIRSAQAFGVDLVVTHGHCVDFLDPKVIRSSLGAVFHTPLVHEESVQVLGRWLEGLRQDRGLQVLGSDSGGQTLARGQLLRRPLALILGNEAKGMSVRLKELAGQVVGIPMTGVVNSLNVACAASILLWQVAPRD